VKDGLYGHSREGRYSYSTYVRHLKEAACSETKLFVKENE